VVKTGDARVARQASGKGWKSSRRAGIRVCAPARVRRHLPPALDAQLLQDAFYRCSS
jgi:hypothetical protein